MNIPTHSIPQHSIETLAKGVYKEAIQYGFEQKDILRLVNTLLQLSMAPPLPPTHDSSLTTPHTNDKITLLRAHNGTLGKE